MLSRLWNVFKAIIYLAVGMVVVWVIMIIMIVIFPIAYVLFKSDGEAWIDYFGTPILYMMDDIS